MSWTGRLDSSNSLVGTGSPFTPPAASHDLTFSGSGQLGWAPGALKPGRGLTCTVTSKVEPGGGVCPPALAEGSGCAVMSVLSAETAGKTGPVPPVVAV